MTVLSCRAAGEGAGAIRAPDDDVVVLQDQSSGCADCIRLTQTAVLGDSGGDGYVVHSNYLVRDSAGHYVVGQYKDMIKVFDASGRYVRSVGRAGQGPGEYSIPMPVYTDARGRVHVLDPSMARETVLGPGYQVDTVLPFPPGLMHAVPLRQHGRYVANAPYRQTAEGIGLPLHLIRDGVVVRSFGRRAEGIVSPFSLVRVLATDRAGRIFSSRPFDYLIEVWDDHGRRLSAFQGPTLSDVAPEPGAFSDDHPPVTKVVAMDPDGQGRLWVLIWQVRADWRAHMHEVRMSGGRTILQPDDGLVNNIYASRLDVIDLEAGTIVARWTGDRLLGAFMGGQALVEFRALNGVPQMVVWQYGLEESS